MQCILCVITSLLFFHSCFFSGSVYFVVGLFPFWFLISVSTLSRYTKFQHLFSADDGSAAGQTNIIEPPRKHILFAHNRSVQSIILNSILQLQCVSLFQFGLFIFAKCFCCFFFIHFALVHLSLQCFWMCSFLCDCYWCCCYCCCCC